MCWSTNAASRSGERCAFPEPRAAANETESNKTEPTTRLLRLVPNAISENMSSLPAQFSGVTVQTKANIYFDGNVVSHTVLMPDNAKKTLGLIRPGSYHFKTGAAERMEIVAGECTVTIDGSSATRSYGAGTHFEVPANSGFTIAVSTGLCEYICSFLA